MPLDAFPVMIVMYLLSLMKLQKKGNPATSVIIF